MAWSQVDREGFFLPQTTPLSAPFHRSSCWAPGRERAPSARRGIGGRWNFFTYSKYLWYGVRSRMMIIITRDKEDVLQSAEQSVVHRRSTPACSDQYRRRSRPPRPGGNAFNTPVRWGGTALDRSGSARGAGQGRVCLGADPIRDGRERLRTGGKMRSGQMARARDETAHPRRLSGPMV